MKNLKNIILIFFSDTYLLILNLITSILIARSLGPELKGVIAYSLSLIQILTPIFLLGLSSSYRYYLSSNKLKLNNTYYSVIRRGIIYYLLLMLLLVALKEFRFYGAMNDYFNYSYLGLLLIYSFLFLMSNINNSVFIGISKFKNYNFIRLLRLSIYCLLLLLISTLFGLNLQLLLIILSFSYIIDLCFSLYFLNSKRNIKFIFRPINILNNYAKKVWITSVIVMSNRRIDQLIIGILIEAKFLGLYSIAVIFSEMANKITDAIAPVFFNIVSKSLNKKDNINLFLRFSRVNFLATVLCLLLLFLFGEFLITFMYGDEFNYAYTILVFYLPGVLFWISTRPIYIYFSSSGLPEINSKIEVYGLIIGVSFLLVLTPIYGILGAAIASTLTYIINFVVAIIYFNKHILKVNIKEMILIKKDDLIFVKGKLSDFVKINISR